MHQVGLRPLPEHRVAPRVKVFGRGTHDGFPGVPATGAVLGPERSDESESRGGGKQVLQWPVVASNNI